MRRVSPVGHQHRRGTVAVTTPFERQRQIHIGRAPEIGDSDQQAAMTREGLLAHADVASPRAGWASGTLQALENPWTSIPNAVLDLVVRLAKPTQAVSLDT